MAGILKLIVTRGVGTRGYRPVGTERSTRILSLQRLARGTEPGPPGPARVRLCRTRLGANPALAGIKTLNRLESVIARMEWADANVWEGLMQDGDGHVVCGTMSNLFLCTGSKLRTPLLDRCGVAGVMRRWIMEQAELLNLRVEERRIHMDDIAQADEVFHEQCGRRRRTGCRDPRGQCPDSASRDASGNAPAGAAGRAVKRLVGLVSVLLLLALAAAGAAAWLGVRSLDEPLANAAPLRYKVRRRREFCAGRRGSCGARRR